MKRGNKILIPLRGIQDGEHRFEFEIKDEFFEYFENPELISGDIYITVELNKKAQFSTLKFKIKGNVTVVCDICLDNLVVSIVKSGQVIVKFGDGDIDNDEDMVFLPDSDSELDLSQYIYETIVLSLPYRRVHPENESGMQTCNSEMLSKLNKHKITDNDNTDPRWDGLKDLLNKN